MKTTLFEIKRLTCNGHGVLETWQMFHLREMIYGRYPLDPHLLFVQDLVGLRDFFQYLMTAVPVQFPNLVELFVVHLSKMVCLFLHLQNEKNHQTKNYNQE